MKPADIVALLPKFDGLKFSENEFRRTKNPVHAWRAIAEAADSKVPIPEWVCDYLLSCSFGIMSLQHAMPQRDQISAAVAKAIGLQGRPRYNPFLELWRPTHDLEIAWRVYSEHVQQVDRLAPGQRFKWPAAYEAVAVAHSRETPRCRVCLRGHVSKGNVERLWRANALHVIPPNVIARARARGAQTLDDILSE